MDETLQEFVDSREATMRIDSARGVIRGVKLLGLKSRNGRRYLPEALRQAVALYEGAKVNINHPKGSPLAARDYQERIGLLRNVRWQADQGLFGDLHFNPKHSLAEQLLWDAEHAPENVGLSHNVQARTSRQGSETLVESILKVQSVDLVADPATTRSLFEDQHPRAGGPGPEASETAAASPLALDAMSLEELRAGRPDLIELLAESVHGDLLRQNAALRLELDEMRAAGAARERRLAVASVLEEFGLPGLEAADEASQSIVSQPFVASLLEAPSVDAVRELVRERAGLIACARNWSSRKLPSYSRPVAREQGADLAPAVDAAAFARSIKAFA